jgi:hypothetical protein
MSSSTNRSVIPPTLDRTATQDIGPDYTGDGTASREIAASDWLSELS